MDAADPPPARLAPAQAAATTPRSLATQLALVTLGYWAAAQLGLLLAIPPGYATAVWPAAGIALAAVLLCGWPVALAVWLGSFLANLPNGFDASTGTALARSVGVPALIAAGAAAQALLGAWLIHRFVGYRNILTQELAVAPMLLLGGPLACVVSATVGVSILLATGAVPPDNFAVSWGTWWVGDTIGVLVVAPIVLAWAVGPRDLWLRRQVLATLPLASLLVMVILLFVNASRRESAGIRAEFDATVADFVTELRKDLDHYAALVTSLRGLMENAENLGPAQFARFSGLVIAQMPPGTVTAWAPLVTGPQRPLFEREQQGRIAPDFEIRDLGANRALVRAAARDRYLPLTYIYPPGGNVAATGFDLLSLPDRARVVARAIQTGRPSMTHPVHLVQDSERQVGMQIVSPVLRGTGSASGPAVAGVVTAALRPPDTMSRALQRLEGHGVNVVLKDDAAPADGRLIYRSRSAAAPAPGDLVQRKSISIFGKVWEAEFVLPARYLVAHRSFESWAVLAAGLLFAGLFGVLILMLIGRTARVELLVAERTNKLAKEVWRSEQLEQDARRQSEKLAASNRELEQFAYIASHDLQAPLRTVASFAGLLRHRYAAALDATGRDFLDAIEEGARSMKSLILALLDLSRVSTERAAMSQVPLGEALDGVCRQIAKDLADAGASVTHGKLPTVRGDRKMLERLLENLISNAIKFQAPGARAVVHVEATRAGACWQIAVRDNGIGIPAGALDDIFLLFHRLHPADRYPGTGIGLAICKKIVDLHGGTISVESEPGKGSVFVVTLPG